MLYTRSSKTRYYTKEENQKFQEDIRYYKKMRLEELGLKNLATLLLDSSLITRTKTKKYSYKIIQCGEYYQIYNYSSKREKNDNLEKIVTYQKENCIKNILLEKNNNKNGYEILKKIIEKDKESRVKDYDIDSTFLFNNKSTDFYRLNIKDKKKIEYKNIMRSKFELQRLIKSNEEKFKTFITLTFAENLKDIKQANKKFDNWRRSIKRIKSDFLYVCVPEFQKRGAVHYHLLTNVGIKENHDLIIPQFNFTDKQYKKMTKKQREKCYDVKYWKHGFSSVFSMKDINVVGYLSKYMTKDIDNRLWGHRRYLYSQNLVKPSTLYLDIDRVTDFKILIDIMNRSDKKYSNIYSDKFGEVIEFNEYKLRS